MLALQPLFEARFWSDIETEKNRDWRNRSAGQRGEDLNTKSDILNRMTRDHQIPWEKRKKVLKASAALKSGATKLLRQERSYLNRKMTGRTASRIDYSSHRRLAKKGR